VHDLLVGRCVEIETVHRLDVHRNAGERRVGRKHHMVAAEELDAAWQAIGAAEHRGVGIELLEIFQVRPLQ
jgi:hypothetical protein